MHTTPFSRDIFLSIMQRKTGYFFNDSFLRHELSPGHPEAPQRLIALQHRIASSPGRDSFIHLPSAFQKSIHIPQIKRVHTDEHIEEVLAIPNTGQAAGDAVAAVIAAVDVVFARTVDNAFCAVRPPGHHAHNSAHNDGRNQGQGFCFFNNVAIAARYVQKRYNARNVLIVDWDYHHGNGTESFFFEDSTVFYFSTHRLVNYPLTGYPTRRGMNDGIGYTVNRPLPRPEYPLGIVEDSQLIDAFTLLPKYLSDIDFTPDFILISAGFDGLERDPLGDFSLSEKVFYTLTNNIVQLADKYCGGKIVSVLEGGYHPESMALAVEYHLFALAHLDPVTINPELFIP